MAVPAGELRKIQEAVAEAKERYGLASSSQVLSCCEADRMFATVSMHVPTVRLNAEQALSCVPAMKRAAVAIANTLSP